jgi:tetratricopeptide (TPR) repeat protein
MNNTLSTRLLTATLLIGTLAFSACAAKLHAQTPEPATQTLLDRAHTLELRGRIDIAAQDWQQVLLIDPNNIDALAGLARSAKLSGNPALANVYLDRIKAINPHAAQQSHPLRQRPRPTTIPPSSVAHRIPDAPPVPQTQSSSNTAPAKVPPPTPAQLSQSTPPSTQPQPQPDIYGPYIPYVPPAPKVAPPQTEVAVAPPLSCPILKLPTQRIVPQRPSLAASRPRILQSSTTLGYGQQYPQPRQRPRIKPIQPPPPPPAPSIPPPPCEQPTPATLTPAPPVS